MCHIDCEVQPNCLLTCDHKAALDPATNQTKTGHTLAGRPACPACAGMRGSVAKPYSSFSNLFPIKAAHFDTYNFAQIFTVFIYNMLAGSIINQWQDIINNPSSLVQTLSIAIPQTATFFICYVITSGIAKSAVRFMRLGSLTVFLLLSRAASTPRARARMWTPESRWYGGLVPWHTMGGHAGNRVAGVAAGMRSRVCVCGGGEWGAVPAGVALKRASRNRDGGGFQGRQDDEVATRLLCGQHLIVRQIFRLNSASNSLCIPWRNHIYKCCGSCFSTATSHQCLQEPGRHLQIADCCSAAVFFLGLMYSVINPIMCPTALASILITFICEKYTSLYTYQAPYESSGKIWSLLASRRSACYNRLHFVMKKQMKLNILYGSHSERLLITALQDMSCPSNVPPAHVSSVSVANSYDSYSKFQGVHGCGPCVLICVGGRERSATLKIAMG
eukprot:363605-Chlamydomonas_euryale.AAC.6